MTSEDGDSVSYISALFSVSDGRDKRLAEDCAAPSSNFQHVPVCAAHNENVHDGLQNVKGKRKPGGKSNPSCETCIAQTGIHIASPRKDAERKHVCFFSSLISADTKDKFGAPV